MIPSGKLAHPHQTDTKSTPTPTPHNRRICDFCGQAKALLYCRADSAKLCFACDKQVHSTNPLFTKHTRSLLCDSCDSKPSSIHCFTDNLVLCQNCDWDSHNTNGCVAHDRRPIEGFTGCPSATELGLLFGFEELGKKKGWIDDGCLGLLKCEDSDGDGDGELGAGVGGGDWLSDLLVWETPSIVSLDDLVLEGDSRQDFHAMGVPLLPKNRDAACGKYKESVLCQLRNMLTVETNLTDDHEERGSLLGFQPLELDPNLQQGSTGTWFENDAKPIIFPINEETGSKLKCGSEEAAVMIPVPSPYSRSLAEESSSFREKTNYIGAGGLDLNGDHDKQPHCPIIRETSTFLSKYAPNEFINHNRDSSLSRYKEKKKTRRYDKHIRYETRKVRAEGRTRIKGRFAKAVDHQVIGFAGSR